MVLVILVLPVLHAMNPLASHQWKNRLLVVTLEPSDAGKLPALLEEFSEEIKERDLRLFPVGFSLTHPSVEKMTEEETLWLRTVVLLSTMATIVNLPPLSAKAPSPCGAKAARSFIRRTAVLAHSFLRGLRLGTP
jgi:hypothetical protein